MSEKSILEMVGGEKHINPHYNIKAELGKEAEDFLKKYLKVDDDEFDFFKDDASCKEEIKRLADFVEPREKRIEILEKENRVLKRFIKDLIYENQNRCFQFSNMTCLFNSDYRSRAEELIGEKL